MNATTNQVWHFEAPLDRRAVRVRASVGLAAFSVLVAAAVKAAFRGSVIGVVIGAAGAVVFFTLAFASWRLARITGPPLVLDEQGLSYDDGLGPRSFLPWRRIVEVALRGGRLGRRIVVVVDDPERRELTLPAVCHGGAPPEWTAGLIETFRQQFLHQS